MYSLIYRESVAKTLRRIPKSQLIKIIVRVESLAVEPRPVGAIKLKGEMDVYRVRQGDYRIIYRVEDKIITVEVIAIGHRKDIYGRN